MPEKMPGKAPSSPVVAIWRWVEGWGSLPSLCALVLLFWGVAPWPTALCFGLALLARGFDRFLKTAGLSEEYWSALAGAQATSAALEKQVGEIAKDVASLKTGARLSGGLR